MGKIYENEIKSLGACVDEFKGEKMIIFFGESAPDTLKDFCYGIDLASASATITAGQTFKIGEHAYKITAVGEIAQRNLESLGHISLVFTGDTQAELPGSIYVEDSEVPDIAKGMKIEIIA